MLKCISLMTRKPHLTKQAYAKHWREIHGPLCRTLKDCRRYVQHHILGLVPNPAGVATIEPNVDSMAELWFDDAAALARYSAAPETKNVHADGVLIVSAVKAFYVDERDLVAATQEPAARCMAILQRPQGQSEADFAEVWATRDAAAMQAARPARYSQLHIASERPPLPTFATNPVTVDGLERIGADSNAGLERVLAARAAAGGLSAGAARFFRTEELVFIAGR